MRATLMYGAGDVRVETVPDPVIQNPTDAIVGVVRAAICAYHAMADRRALKVHVTP